MHRAALNTSVVTRRNPAKLAMRLRTDHALSADKALGLVKLLGADDVTHRVGWVALLLPLPDHEDRMREARELLKDCGFLTEVE